MGRGEDGSCLLQLTHHCPQIEEKARREVIVGDSCDPFPLSKHCLHFRTLKTLLLHSSRIFCAGDERNVKWGNVKAQSGKCWVAIFVFCVAHSDCWGTAGLDRGDNEMVDRTHAGTAGGTAGKGGGRARGGVWREGCGVVVCRAESAARWHSGRGSNPTDQKKRKS
ncbi:hypothetical protein BLNAU_2338 [Blattamonas nauphoetae]|uniref:Uncharacterized protein n=1 Tax=Blattamonas nauphoetae TaxID=2049346 RepID=A0ABQ9YFG7_9EUKA|nr:hypothetical protein BLNAU_2338 [Blattamonas nauphoetae]